MPHDLLALSQGLLFYGKAGDFFALKLKLNHFGHSCDLMTPN